MASERTRRLIRNAESVTKLGNAIRARNRLREEAIKLTGQRLEIDRRLGEIDGEEEILAAAIDDCGDLVAAANAEPRQTGDPGE